VSARSARPGTLDSRGHTSNGAGHVPRVALRWPEEVAEALGVSADTLDRHDVVADLKLWRLGRIRLVPVAELERLVQSKATRVLDEERP
jgi:hypothetical protein